MLDMTELVKHPEQFDRDTLYELRSMLALHPYSQTVRLLLLHNLFLLHDPSFDEELRRASLYITDRRSIFNIVEAAHYQLTAGEAGESDDAAEKHRSSDSRTVALIDTFLGTIPAEEPQDKKRRRKPTPADAATDYVGYLLASEGEWEAEAETESAPLMKGQDLIDQFLQQERPRIVLGEVDAPGDVVDIAPVEEETPEEEYFTETLARIYIRQGRYQKALEIIRRLSDGLPQKNAYFADQIRFLEKLVINSNNKK